ncbi:hypothetical protein GWK47_043308 [Chionoecetes opilio]|uniref:Uncharacterized protein n=1 Tax=Chionoecetes opilio TaxID=41210 RepID=A0A8J4YH36_CHIOP|nr:hypothetical protein GWK47_043308 [Chionoecetes opilio]
MPWPPTEHVSLQPNGDAPHTPGRPTGLKSCKGRSRVTASGPRPCEGQIVVFHQGDATLGEVVQYPDAVYLRPAATPTESRRGPLRRVGLQEAVVDPPGDEGKIRDDLVTKSARVFCDKSALRSKDGPLGEVFRALIGAEGLDQRPLSSPR